MAYNGAIEHLIFDWERNNQKEISIEDHFAELKSISLDRLVLMALTKDRSNIISPSNIPQFSNFIDGSIRVLDYASKLHDIELNYLNMGKYLLDKGKRKCAYIKYGENHMKLARELGLIDFSEGYLNMVTPIGEKVLELKNEQVDEVIRKLVLRIPVVVELLRIGINKPVNVDEYLDKYLAKSTAIRRTSNIRSLFTIISNGIQCDEIRDLIEKNIG